MGNIERIARRIKKAGSSCLWRERVRLGRDEKSNLFHEAQKLLLSTEGALKKLMARLPDGSEPEVLDFDSIIGLVMDAIDVSVSRPSSRQGGRATNLSSQDFDGLEETFDGLARDVRGS